MDLSQVEEDPVNNDIENARTRIDEELRENLNEELKNQIGKLEKVYLEMEEENLKLSAELENLRQTLEESL